MRINGFEQMKAFYSWVFDNAEKGIKPQHISLYVFLLNQNNRSLWVEWFKCPYDLAMQGACIGNKKTYYNCLEDLQNWGLIEYQKGVNEWKAPLIRLEPLVDANSVPQSEIVEVQNRTSTVPQDTPLPTPQGTPLPTPQGTQSNKHITNNIKQVTGDEIIDEVYKAYPTKCPIQKRSLGKSASDKKRIQKLLAKHTKEDLLFRINGYVADCVKNKIYLKNFSALLNNLPDIDTSTKNKKEMPEAFIYDENGLGVKNPEYTQWQKQQA